jgi:hypothetical protein
MDYTQILENLYVGSFPKTPEDIDTLKAANITAVFNLQTKDDETYWKINWQSLHDHYQSHEIKVQRIPVRDFDPMDLREKLPAVRPRPRQTPGGDSRIGGLDPWFMRVPEGDFERVFLTPPLLESELLH